MQVNALLMPFHVVLVLSFIVETQFLLCRCCHRYVDVIEQAVVSGEPVLIENLEETIEPVIDPLLGRHTIKKGR